MARKFKTVDYEAALDMTIAIRDCLPSEHMVHFVVKIVNQLDLRCINGMITNDKFCLSRNGQLQLSWSRIGLYECRRSQRPKVGYPSRNTDHSGGKCETTMASSSPDQSEIGRAATLGSGLSTATEVEPGARAEQLAADQNHPNANSGDT